MFTVFIILVFIVIKIGKFLKKKKCKIEMYNVKVK